MNPKQNPARPSEIPPDVEARYRAIQAEMQQLQLAPEALVGESREARYARQQRLRQLRREFDAASRYPLARRQRSAATTVVLMASVGVLLCMLSIGGGVLVNNILSRPPDISGTITNFMDDIKSQDYSSAYTYLAQNGQDVQAFIGTAGTADNAMGNVIKYQQISQINGKSGDVTASVTFNITRAGNDSTDLGYDKRPGGVYPSIVVIMTYGGDKWRVSDYGSLFRVVPLGDTPTPAVTPTPAKGK
ncbi:MAG: hypothetical protein H0X24_23195 [Ktedonobacterales bacterium]|nr:hypothetical protein [Ktedonobacterales bacterium]